MRAIPCPISEAELRDLYIRQKLIDEDIAALIPGGTVKRIRSWRKRFGIETIPRWSRNEVLPIEGRLQSLLVGSMLGDGRIVYRGTSSQFVETHSEEQKAYLEWKMNIWGSWVQSPLLYTPKYKDGRVFPAWRMTTVCHGSLNDWQTLFYEARGRGWKRFLPEVVDIVDDFALTVWYLDDGYPGWWPGITFGADPASREVVLAICENFGLHPRWQAQRGNTGQIHIEGEEQALRFINIIRPHVPECMSHKIEGFGFQGPHYQVRQKLSEDSLQTMVGVGLSAREMGRKMGVGASTVSRHLNKHGMKTICGPSSFERGMQNKDLYAERYPDHHKEGTGFVEPGGIRVQVRTARLLSRSDNRVVQRWSFGLRPADRNGKIPDIYSCLCLDETGVVIREYRIPMEALGDRRVIHIYERGGGMWSSYRVGESEPDGDFGDILDLFT